MSRVVPARYAGWVEAHGWLGLLSLLGRKTLRRFLALQAVWYGLGLAFHHTRNLLRRATGGALCGDAESRLRRFRIYEAPRRAEEGMTTWEEQAFLEHYGRVSFTGRGQLVDLGSFVGSSIVPLARGLARNPRAAGQHRIHAFDRFVWEPWMDGAMGGTALSGRYRAGQSFIDSFEQLTALWSDRIAIRPGDLKKLGWDGGPIEFCFVDAMKSWDLANAIVATFFPHLLPGAVVVHQDYTHRHTGWIHLIMYRLSEWFEPIEHVPHSSSFVFRYRGGAPEELLRTALSFEEFSADELDAAFAESLANVKDEMRCNVAAAKVMCWVHRGKPAEARREQARLLAAGIPNLLEFTELDHWIKLAEKGRL